jgi:hypothetical protein
MIKLLIATMSCNKNRHKQKACTDTWFGQLVSECDETVKPIFVVGGEIEGMVGHTLVLPVPDTYGGLVLKVKATVRWALEHQFTHILKLDDDTYLRGKCFLKAFPTITAPYTGRAVWARHGELQFAHGGGGYLLNEQSMQIVADKLSEEYGRPEDCQIGRVLKDAGIRITNDRRFCPWNLPIPEGQFTSHYLKPMDMYRIHDPDLSQYQEAVHRAAATMTPADLSKLRPILDWCFSREV